MEQEIHRIWILVSELSDQLAQNNRVAADLHQQIQTLKEQASSTAKTTPLRRFNVNLANELFDSDLERAIVGLIIENQQLLQENKQLNALMTDYEQTLRTVMTKFRHYVQSAAEKEMTILGHYKTLLASSETASSTQTYNPFVLSQGLERLRGHIELVMQNEGGEDPQHPSIVKEMTVEPSSRRSTDDASLIRVADDPSNEQEASGIFDWSIEREEEIKRLEMENEELRRHLGILEEPEGSANEGPDPITHSQRHSRSPSAPFGAGFTTTSISSPQGGLNSVSSPFGSSPFPTNSQSYNPPSAFTTPDRKFAPPMRGIGPTPPQLTNRSPFGEGSMGPRQPPSFPNFFRGAPPNRDDVDTNGGHPSLL